MLRSLCCAVHRTALRCAALRVVAKFILFARTLRPGYRLPRLDLPPPRHQSHLIQTAAKGNNQGTFVSTRGALFCPFSRPKPFENRTQTSLARGNQASFPTDYHFLTLPFANNIRFYYLGATVNPPCQLLFFTGSPSLLDQQISTRVGPRSSHSHAALLHPDGIGPSWVRPLGWENNWTTCRAFSFLGEHS